MPAQAKPVRQFASWIVPAVDELLEGWARWLRRGMMAELRGGAKHPLARLMDGAVGGVPVYCPILPAGLDDDAVFSRVDLAVGKLPPRYREIIRLKYCQRDLEEYQARDLGISVNAFRVRLCRAKACLMRSAIFVECATL